MRLAGMLILAMGLLGAATSNAAVRLEETEQSLGRLPFRKQSTSVHVSPDGRRVAYVVKRGWRVATVIDGVESTHLYDWIVGNQIQFTPDGKHILFQIKKAGRVAVVTDGVEGRQYDQTDPLVFSPRSAHIAYAAKRNEKYVAVMNGQEQPKWYDDVRSVAVSDDGKLAYVATEKGKSCCVVDGVEGRWYDEVADVGISLDGKHVGYRARLKEFWTIVINGNEGEWHEQVTPVVFSESGGRWGYFAIDKANGIFIIDGKQSPPYAPRRLAGPAFSADGKHVAYTGSEDWQEFIVHNGRPEKPEAGAFLSHQFGPGENPVLASILSRREGVQCVLIDGQAHKSYTEIRALVFSPDGKRCAYAAQRGPRGVVVVDGAESEAFDGVEAWSLCFSEDSKHVACIAQTPRGYQVVIDGVKGKEYETIVQQQGMRFAPDGTLRFVIARGVGEKSIAVKDQEKELVRVTVKLSEEVK